MLKYVPSCWGSYVNLVEDESDEDDEYQVFLLLEMGNKR